MLDVGITTVTKQYKMDIDEGLGKVDASIVNVLPPLPMTAQSNYKFIIHVDGNVFAYRLLKTMLTGSCILRVTSRYKGWMDIDRSFKGFSIDQDSKTDLTNKCFIWIKSSLENLDEVLDWCLANDAACKQIAKNGREYALRVLEKKYIYSSFINTLNASVDTAMSGGAPLPKQKQKQKQKQTRKQKVTKRKTRKAKKHVEEDELVLAKYRAEDISSEMESYIQSTFKNLWQTFAKKTTIAF